MGREKGRWHATPFALSPPLCHTLFTLTLSPPLPLPSPPPHSTVVDLVGGTPLVRLRKVVPRSKDTAKIFAKLESMQPNSSVKDRCEDDGGRGER